jgi:purine-cytosine permease-like protein
MTGIFLCLFGACMVLVGGACTAVWLVFGMRGMGTFGPLLFLLSLALLGLGIFIIRTGVKAFAAGDARPPPVDERSDDLG